MSFGYYDLYKKDGILEDDVFIKSFSIGKTTICWCDSKKYRKKYNVPRYQEEDDE